MPPTVLRDGLPFDRLSDRSIAAMRIAILSASGYAYKEISERLGLSHDRVVCELKLLREEIRAISEEAEQ